MKKPQIIIDKNKLIKNFNYYNKHKYKIICVVKSNSYGIGIYNIVPPLLENGANFFAVFTLEDAIKIRKLSKKCFILILNSIERKDIKTCLINNLTISINSWDDYLMIKNNSYKIPVHIKIDTGMHRYGVNKVEFFQIINDKDLNINGVFSHLIGGKDEFSYIKQQITIFDKLIEPIDKSNLLIHICSTSSHNIVSSKYQNAIRIGLGLYGFSKNTTPCIKLMLPIISIRQITKGEYCSYNCSFKSPSDGYLYLIPVGYHNWLYPDFKIKFKCFVNAGKICMNCLLLFSKNLYNKKVITLNSYDLIKLSKINNVSIYWLLSSFVS